LKKALIVISILCAVASARAEIQLRGIMKADHGYMFFMCDTEGKVSSRWAALGSIFGGYTLISYDAEKSLIRLQKGNIDVEAKLQSARVDGEAPVDIRTLTDGELESLGLHRIKSGETLARIALAEGVTLAELLALNPDVQSKHLRVGQIIVFSDEPPPKHPAESQPLSTSAQPTVAQPRQPTIESQR
jgi:LysM repeat protein